MAVSALLAGLNCSQVETRLRSCWSAQKRAELAGDERSAQHMRDRIDELLEQWARL